MEYIIADAVMETIEKRGLKLDDVKAVIEGAGDDKISKDGKFIAKKEIGEVTVYAMYAVDGDKVTVEAAYSHKLKILDIVLVGEEDSGWVYCKNNKPVFTGHTNLTYLGATRSGPSLVEPESGESWFEEYLAAGALATAEVLFQQKRA